MTLPPSPPVRTLLYKKNVLSAQVQVLTLSLLGVATVLCLEKGHDQATKGSNE